MQCMLLTFASTSPIDLIREKPLIYASMNTAFLNPWWGVGPLGILICAIKFCAWQQARTGKRSPVSDKLLRPPGESLRQGLRDMEFRLMERFALLAMFSGFLPLTLKQSSSTTMHGQILATLLPAALLAAMAWLAISLTRLLKRHRDYDLGFNGERFVGEQLNTLLSSGCRVFHDFPAKGFGNIDHIVVTRTGVFAIETKAISKDGNLLRGARDYDVIFDGHRLQFPNSFDTGKLKQAGRAAQWLADYLTSAIGAAVEVVPILTLPGWMVIRQGKGQVNVLNPKEIDSATLNALASGLPTQSFDSICNKLDQKCRDIQF